MAHDLIVFSRRPWTSAPGRVQELMTRFAQDQRIFYLQQPEVSTAQRPQLQYSEPQPNLTVCQPWIGAVTPGWAGLELPALKALLEELILRFEIQGWAAWLQTPMALPLLSGQHPDALIYDCLEHPVPQPRASEPRLEQQELEHEAALLQMADLVLVSGLASQDPKLHKHPGLYILPCGRQREPGGQAPQGLAEPPEQVRLPRPRLGYFGVIDERLDLELIGALADAHPEWQVVLVGPVVNRDPDALPLNSNVYYFGQQDPSALPRFLSGWDLCLLPLNADCGSRCLSAARALEYLAAERPVVATPSADSGGRYRDVFYFGETHERFIQVCEDALSAPQAAQQRGIERMRQLHAKLSWDSTAACVAGRIAALVNNAGRTRALGDEPLSPPSLRAVEDMPEIPILREPVPILHETVHSIRIAVLGAGPTGLSLAYHLGEQALLVEQERQPGGNCRPHRHGRFTFDLVEPGLRTRDDSVQDLYRTLLGDDLRWRESTEWVYSAGAYTCWPLHEHLHGLPLEVIRDCIHGAAEAQFAPAVLSAQRGAGTAQRQTPGSDLPLPRSPGATDGRSGVESVPGLQRKPAARREGNVTWPFINRRRVPRNFEDHLYAAYGNGIARHFAIPYYAKLWATPLRDLEPPPDNATPLPDLDAIIEGALRPCASQPKAVFGYPAQGGLQALMSSFLPHLGGELRFGSAVTAIAPSEHLLTLDDGSIYQYQSLVSTLPLAKLLNVIEGTLPDAIQDAVAQLRYLSSHWVCLGIDHAALTDKEVIHSAGDSVFHRVLVQDCDNPPGSCGVSCEIAYSDRVPLPANGDELIARCVQDLIGMGLLQADDKILATHQLDVDQHSVIPDHGSGECLERIRSWLARQGITLAGSDGRWQRQTPLHPFAIGRDAALAILDRRSRRSATG